MSIRIQKKKKDYGELLAMRLILYFLIVVHSRLISLMPKYWGVQVGNPNKIRFLLQELYIYLSWIYYYYYRLYMLVLTFINHWIWWTCLFKIIYNIWGNHIHSSYLKFWLSKLKTMMHYIQSWISTIWCVGFCQFQYISFSYENDEYI